MGKGEIACYEQFLLFLLCFQKTLYCRHVKNQGLFGKGLNICRNQIEGGSKDRIYL